MSVFHWLTERLKEVTSELGEFVKIEDAEMSESDFAWQAICAAKESCAR